MRRQFQQFISAHQLLAPGDSVLLAVSGGVDSMVMAHLFLGLGYGMGVAHCNFGLRGLESDADQELVKRFAERYQLPYHTIRFNTEQYANENGISIQMAARALRYAWFNEIQQESQYTRVAVAHHADDAIETFFINLLRGTGLQGLAGMRAVHGSIVRPLLFASRNDIAAFANQHSVPFREDASNASDKYARNKLRHVVLPAMESINPVFRHRMAVNMLFLEQAQAFIVAQMQQVRALVTSVRNENTYIAIDALRRQPVPELCLFYLLEPYGFKNSLVLEIMDSLDAPSGKTFTSASHQLVKDRSDLIVTPLNKEGTEHYLLDQASTSISSPIALSMRSFPRQANFVHQKSPRIAQLDCDLLKFPLLLRRWQAGDSFSPLGMEGSKKLSDFFIDQKLSLVEKERQWILLSEDRIVWVLGCRMDNRFKITEHTSRILEIQLN